MKKRFILTILTMMNVTVFFLFVLFSSSYGFNPLFDLLDKITGNDRRTQILPGSPNPVVYEVQKPIETVIDKVKTVLTDLNFTEVAKEERSDRSYTISAYQKVKPTVVNPQWADTVRGKVTIKIIPSEDKEGMYLMTIIGEHFDGFVYYHHLPPHKVVEIVSKRIERAFTPAFITSGSTVDNKKFYIGNTDKTIDDIEKVEVYSSSISDIPDFERLVQYIGGYSGLIGKEKILVRFTKGRNEVGSLKSVLDFYKFAFDDTVAKNEGPFNMKTVITLKDGNQITVPHYRDDMFRKRFK